MAAEPHPALAALKDIHAAPPVEWWPPAPGWWLLLLLTIVLAAWLIQRWQGYYRRLQLRRRTLARLEDLKHSEDIRGLTAAVNGILKQVAIARFGRRKISSLYGEAWLEFLAASGSGDGPAPELLAGGYQQQTASQDSDQLLRWAQRWVKQHV